MGKKTAAERAKNVAKRRAKLIRELGGECVECGADFDLEFHHVNGRTWIARKTSRWVRIKRYEEEACYGLIELLCADCNKVAGKPNLAKEVNDEEPF